MRCLEGLPLRQGEIHAAEQVTLGRRRLMLLLGVEETRAAQGVTLEKYHDPPTPVRAMRCWPPGYRAETIAGLTPLRAWLLLHPRESEYGVRYDRLPEALLLRCPRHRGTVRGGYCCGDADGGSSGVGVTPGFHFPVCEAGWTWRAAGVGCACGVERDGGCVRLLPCRCARREVGRRFRRDSTGGLRWSDVESGYLSHVHMLGNWIRTSGDAEISRFLIPR